jgi:DTW domain-containing protein YfiP
MGGVAAFRPIPQGIRGFKVERCERCWMPKSACLCAELPSLPTQTRVVIVMPWKESGRSSNTGRLANLVLPNAEVRLRGQPGSPLDLSDLAGESGLLLFPDSAACPLEPAHGQGPPRVLVVPDGTWRQARRVVKHERALDACERVSLPPGPPSAYLLRKARRPGWVCTYEAISRALSILEGPAMGAAMLPAFQLMVERTLAFRGRRGRPG